MRLFLLTVTIYEYAKTKKNQWVSEAAGQDEIDTRLVQGSPLVKMYTNLFPVAGKLVQTNRG